VFCSPLLAAKVIVEYVMPTLLMSVLTVALLNWLITVVRLIWRRIASHKILQAT